MSTFGGKIKEFPGLSVDRFDGENLNSTVFFLSHCHTDHMSGLSSQYFQEKIVRENRFLYLSSVSAVILRSQYPYISSQIKELALEHVTSIFVQNRNISVTCIPAGHCPGSVMFLFEDHDKRILYTGDFRINPSDIQKFKCFYDIFDNVKSVDKIYLDTTFFLKSYSVFPKRKDSLSEICKIILSWITQDPENCVKLDARAKYGYEYVFKEVYDRCKMPVHVDIEKYSFYSLIPELDKCITTNGAATQIHNCFWKDKVCEFCDISKLRTIKISAMRWQNNDFQNGLSEIENNGNFNVCYSTHASYEEGVALIDFLKPKDIHICVERPDDPVKNKMIKTLIDEKLDEINHRNRKINKPKLFKINENNSELVLQSFKNNDEDLIDGIPPKKLLRCDILDSPPR